MAAAGTAIADLKLPGRRAGKVLVEKEAGKPVPVDLKEFFARFTPMKVGGKKVWARTEPVRVGGKGPAHATSVNVVVEGYVLDPESGIYRRADPALLRQLQFEIAPQAGAARGWAPMAVSMLTGNIPRNVENIAWLLGGETGRRSAQEAAREQAASNAVEQAWKEPSAEALEALATGPVAEPQENLAALAGLSAADLIALAAPLTGRLGGWAIRAGSRVKGLGRLAQAVVNAAAQLRRARKPVTVDAVLRQIEPELQAAGISGLSRLDPRVLKLTLASWFRRAANEAGQKEAAGVAPRVAEEVARKVSAWARLGKGARKALTVGRKVVTSGPVKAGAAFGAFVFGPPLLEELGVLPSSEKRVSELEKQLEEIRKLSAPPPASGVAEVSGVLSEADRRNQLQGAISKIGAILDGLARLWASDTMERNQAMALAAVNHFNTLQILADSLAPAARAVAAEAEEWLRTARPGQKPPDSLVRLVQMARQNNLGGFAPKMPDALRHRLDEVAAAMEAIASGYEAGGSGASEG